jgi:hypothetical protein
LTSYRACRLLNGWQGDQSSSGCIEVITSEADDRLSRCTISRLISTTRLLYHGEEIEKAGVAFPLEVTEDRRNGMPLRFLFSAWLVLRDEIKPVGSIEV